MQKHSRQIKTQKWKDHEMFKENERFRMAKCVGDRREVRLDILEELS